MKIPEEAWQSLREALTASGLSKELESASQEDLEQLGHFLLNLTAAAIKTREKLRSVGTDLGPSPFPASEDEPTSQAKLPGLDD
jgi:hypothetical protein